jgi:hypothetical protein
MFRYSSRTRVEKPVAFMSLSRTPYTLNAEQLDAALVALGKASETFRLSPLENRLYRALGVCAKIAIVAFVITAILVIMSLNGVAAVTDLIIGIPGLIFMAAGIIAALLLAANATLVLNAVRQRRLLKQLGLHDVSYSAWKAYRKRHVFARVGGAMLTTVGAVLLLFVFAWLMGAEKPGPAEIAFGVACLVVGITILIWRAVQRSRERLEVVADADQLRTTLTSIKTGADASVVVPANVLEKVAGIEHVQIARERAHAVLAGVGAENRGYGVLITRDVSESKAALVPDRRLEVEELIDDVVADPHAYAGGQHGDEVLRARTPDGSAEVDYSVDEAHRRVHIVALRIPGNAGTVRPSGGHRAE